VTGKERIEWAVAAVASLAFGVSFGWDYGVDNQVVYLLGSLKMATPGSFQTDWFATQTTHYHPAYELLGALLLLIRRDGALIAYGQTLVIATGTLCMFWTLRVLVKKLALPSFLLLCCVMFETRTSGMGGSYVFDHILQPSTLAGAAFFAAVPLFAQARWRASSVALAVSGLFHANYMLLSCGVFFVAHLLLGRDGLRRRMLEQFVMPTLVILAFSPMIIATAGSPLAKQAQEIYFNVRAPHHFLLARFQLDLVPFAAWQMIGFGALWPMVRNGKSPLARVAVLATGMATVVWLGVAASAAGSRTATQLFAWRLSPHLEILLQLSTAAVALTVATQPGLVRRWTGPGLALILGGLALLSTAELMAKQPRLPAFLVATAFVVVACAALGHSRAKAKLALVVPIVTSVLLLAGVGWQFVERFDSVRDRSVFLNGINPYDRELTLWMRRNTPKDARFLTHPGIETIRYHGQRAIVVDWKSNPIVPGELLEWIRRLEDVSGRKIRGAGDLGGYDSLDNTRLEHLKAKYRLDFAVVQRGRERALGYPTVWSNARFVVLDLRGRP
jgi:hypothetical protein